MCRINDVTQQQPVWRHIQAYDKPNKEQQSGTGILSKIGAYLNPAALYAGERATNFRNALPDSDDTARDGFPGEKHAILKLANGKNGVANYMGPGTEVVKRIKRKDPPRTPADAVAMAHDLRYTLAKDVTDIRHADEKMLEKLDKIKDAPRNIFLGKRLIQAKVAAEKAGLLSRDKFATKGFKRPPPEDAQVLEDALKTMQMQGYGLSLAGGNKRRKKGQHGGFFFAIPALIAAISSAASAAMATGIPTAMATAALTGAAGAAGAAVVKKISGTGLTSKLQRLVKQTKVGMRDLSAAGQAAVKKAYQHMKQNPDQVKKVIETLAPHFKKAIADKVKQKLGPSGSGLVLAGGSVSDEDIASRAMKNLDVNK
jgi:hypothetical protein